METTERLAERVRNCVPLRHPAFGKLLQLVSVEETGDVPTAAVTLGTRSRLLINPAFVAERCRTDEHFAMLVMHELYHVLLGHTRMYKRSTLRANWAFDCIINAQLCRLYPSAEYTSFFAACAAKNGPWSLLGPPPGWPAKKRYARSLLGDVHKRLYDDSTVTTVELFALLEDLGEAAGALGGEEEVRARLLGNHAPEEGTDPLWDDPGLMAEVRGIVARWPMAEERSGLDDGADATDRRSALVAHPEARRAIGAVLRKAAFGASGGPLVRREEDVPAVTVLPHPSDRRAHLWMRAGATPLLWNGSVRNVSLERAGRVAVYLDVSGSMGQWMPVLMKALSDHADLVEWPLYGFSTAVHPVTSIDLAKGKFRSTGGTHIGCVARHLLEKKFARAVVITDGDVQRIPRAEHDALRRTHPRVEVGLLDGCSGAFCETLGWRTHAIPPL